MGIVAWIAVGFDFSRHSISLSEIHDGGPPKDGIPALTDPKFVSAKEAVFLNSEDQVLGIHISGEAKAYPISILNWHELVNDRVGGKPILVSFCPLCGTGMVFDAEMDGGRGLFGVSGKLYNSDVLFYDKGTESLWSQILMEAVTGPLTGRKIKLLASERTTWEAWRSKYPEGKVLSTDTGYARDYFRNPYAGYESNARIYFPVAHMDSRLHPKAWVLGIILNGEAKAYPFDQLKKISRNPLKDQVGGETILISYDRKAQSAVVQDVEGRMLASIQAYWFAWSAFYPGTQLYEG
ncbi:MAG: DUF3179 domain-containing protein [Candidatus Omnitrophica bacterium]|nr:DUF3179 domain-containing protein [Candidatus Omnitrophota bacterium]